MGKRGTKVASRVVVNVVEEVEEGNDGGDAGLRQWMVMIMSAAPGKG